MSKQYVYFHELPVNTRFLLNGNLYRKKSKRTAEVVKPDIYSGTWFYFKERDLCIVGEHSRLGPSYGF